MTERTPIPDHIIAMMIVGFFLVIMLILYMGNRSSDRYWARRREMENEELREQAAFDRHRRERAQAYFLDKVHTHDREVIDYVVEKKVGLLGIFQREPDPEPQARQPFNIHYNSPPPRREPQRETFRQPETRYEPPPEPRERVVFVHEPYREPPPRKRLPFWGDDDDIIDVTPGPPRHHRAMPQVPLLGAPRNKGGRPRKHSNNAAKQRNYNQRKKQS